MRNFSALIFARSLCCIALLFFLTACASLQSGFATPSVKLVSLTALPANGLEQRFAIGLRVANPNGTALNLVGMTYSIELEGFKLISGVSNNIPTIAAYDETLVEVEASVNCKWSSRMSSRRERFEGSLMIRLYKGLFS